MSDLRDAALRAAIWGVIADAAKERQSEAKQELAGMESGDTIAAKLDGRLVGKASLTSGRSKLVVTDERKLLEWVKEHHPTEIVEAVNPAFMQTFGTVEGLAHWQGEPVSFLTVAEGAPYITIRKDPNAADVVADLLASGRVSLEALDTKAIEGVLDVEEVA